MVLSEYKSKGITPRKYIMKYTTVNLELEVKKVLKIHCATLDVPMSDYVKEAVQEKMEREPLE